MTIEDHIWEFFSLIYYFLKDFQTLIAAIIILLGGRWVYLRQRKLQKDKQVDQGEAAALIIQTKIEDAFTKFIGLHGSLDFIFKVQKKNFEEGRHELAGLRYFLIPYFIEDTYFSRRKNLTALSFLDFQKGPVFSFYSLFESLRLLFLNEQTHFYKVVDKTKVPHNSDGSIFYDPNYLSTFSLTLKTLEAAMNTGIVALDNLQLITGHTHHNRTNFDATFLKVRELRKEFEKEKEKLTKTQSND